MNARYFIGRRLPVTTSCLRAPRAAILAAAFTALALGLPRQASGQMCPAGVASPPGCSANGSGAGITTLTNTAMHGDKVCFTVDIFNLCPTCCDVAGLNTDLFIGDPDGPGGAPAALAIPITTGAYVERDAAFTCPCNTPGCINDPRCVTPGNCTIPGEFGYEYIVAHANEHGETGDFCPPLPMAGIGQVSAYAQGAGTLCRQINVGTSLCKALAIDIPHACCEPCAGTCTNVFSAAECPFPSIFTPDKQCDEITTCTPLICPGPVPPCEGGQVCNPDTGTCVNNPDAPLSTPCTGCPGGDTQCNNCHCNGAGLCVNNPEPLSTVCEADVPANLCRADHCDGAGNCVRNTAIPETMCPGPVPPCEGGQVCNPSTGTCVNNPDAPLSTPCTGCPGGDTQCNNCHCSGTGTCVNNPEPLSTVCEADVPANLCTPDHCDGAGNCVRNTAIPEVTCSGAVPPCEGGQVCNPSTGTCVNNPDAPLSTPCTGCPGGDTQCNNCHCSGTGTCVNNPEPFSTVCEAETPANLCTPDHCNGAGACVRNFAIPEVMCAGPVPPCEGGQVCNPATGTCVNNPDAPLSTPCTGCPGGDTQCNNCHCSGTGTCVNNPEPLSTVCEADVPANLCRADHCDGAGNCVRNTAIPETMCPGPVPPCEGGQRCEPTTGACVNNPDAPLSTPCIGCPGGDTQCNNCHCNGEGLCANNPEPFSTVCILDANLCTTEHCDGTGNCVPLGTACADPNFCNDNDPCTRDICDITAPGCCRFEEIIPCTPERAHPGWNNQDCQFLLTAHQPTYFSVLTGCNDDECLCTPFTALDPGIPPGRPDPDVPGGRMLRGFIYAWAVDNTGCEIRHNHLKGDALIVNYDETAAWEYNAHSFECTADVATGDRCAEFDKRGADDCGELNLNGLEYDSAFDQLLLDFYATGSDAFSNDRGTVMLDTDLTLYVVDVDLRQDSVGPITTKAFFDIWNQDEFKRSGTERCITCWDQTPFSRYTTFTNNFLISNLHTDKGKARIDGQQSFRCVPGICAVTVSSGNLIRCTSNAQCPLATPCIHHPLNQAAPLLGVAHKRLVFSGVATGVAHAGTTLFGTGEQSTSILYDVSDPPDELRQPTAEPEAGPELEPGRGLRGEPSGRRVDVSKKGSLLIFSKVEIKWDSLGQVTEDTFIDIANDFNRDVFVQLYFINGDPPLEETIIGGNRSSEP